MSIMIMSRLFRMNLGGCNRKLLAVRLADFADDDGRGIYPGVKRLATETELSERTIQRILSDFVSEGILIVVQEASGRPGQATRYDFDLGRLFAYKPQTGDSVSPVVKGKTGDIAAETGDTDDRDGCHGDTRTVIEPPIEPLLEREAREREFDGSGEEDPKAALRAFKRWYPNWPTYVDDSEPKALKAWMDLSAEERKEAAEKSEAYIAAVKAAGRKYTCSSPIYLSEKRWLKLEALQAAKPKAAAPVANGRVAVPVYGPAFAAARMLPLLQGPVKFELPEDLRERMQATYEVHNRRSAQAGLAYRERIGAGLDADGSLIFPHDFEGQEYRRRVVTEGFPETNRLHYAAKERGHVTVDAACERMKDLCEFVPVGSAVWSAWEREHAARGWPMLPAPSGNMKGAYFPKGGPEGLEEFERAARLIMAAREEDDAA